MNQHQLEVLEEIFRCNKCETLSKPAIALVGNPEAKIWIIGLNPKLEDFKAVKISNSFKEYLTEQRNYFNSKDSVHRYFNDFKYVFGENWLDIFQNSVAHLDLVKCHSKAYDKKVKMAIDKCGHYLLKQITLFKPHIILCNGTDVCKWFASVFDFEIGDKTRKDLEIEDYKFTVIFSGFIGRIDNYSKRRLGREVKKYIIQYNLKI